MNGTCEVWVLPQSRRILVTEYPGPPMEIVGYVSQEAGDSAQKRGYATVSELGFPKDCYLGEFNLPIEGGWGEAEKIARAKAAELGYEVVYEAFFIGLDDEEEADDWEPYDWRDDDGGYNDDEL